MNKSGSSTKFTVSFHDWAIWSQQLQSETDRGLATIAAAILDHLLARLIEGFLVDDPTATKALLGDPFSPLGTFAARLAVAYSLGLISQDERDDLDNIRKIRNDFAHQPTSPSFSDQSIAQKVNNLKTPKMFVERFPASHFQLPRQLFTDAVSMLSTFIDIRTNTSVERRTHPKNFKMQYTKPPT